MKRLPVLLLVAALAAVALTGVAAVSGPVAPARADARVDVVNDRGGADADLTYRTRLTVTGRGFQNVPGGFGGVYVLFGWVDDPAGGWRPSRGGLTGKDYQYVPDAEDTADNQGYLRFVAFPGSSTAGEAAAVLSSSGGFEVDLTVPGPVFQSVDRDGQVAEVDCREVTCGVITLGAHGVKNARNETFTPVAFGTVYDAAPAGTTQTEAPATAPPTTSAPAAPDAAPASAAPRSTATRATGTTAAAGLTVDRATAVRGHALAFSARGLTAGEQVVAVLDDGVAAVGPVTAGTSGEVAGVLLLPADLEVGTHELRVTGAVSGRVLTELFPVGAGDRDAASDAGAVAAPSATSGPSDAAWAFLGLAAVALLLAGLALVRARRARRTPVGPVGPVGPVTA